MPAKTICVNCGHIFQRPSLQMRRRIASMSPGWWPTTWRAISSPCATTARGSSQIDSP